MKDIHSITKVRIKATYPQTKAKHQASEDYISRLWGTDPKAINSQLEFIPSDDESGETNDVAGIRNIITAGKKAIIEKKVDDTTKSLVKSALKPVGPDEIGWYYCQSEKDVDVIREICDDTQRKIDAAKSRIEMDWDNLIARGKTALGAAPFVFPSCEDFLEKGTFSVTFKQGAIDFSETALAPLSDELKAQLKADAAAEKKNLIEAHRAGVDSFFESVIHQVGKMDESLIKGKRLKSNGFDSLLEEARDLERDNWIGDKTISKISEVFTTLIQSIEKKGDLWNEDQKTAHKNRKAAATEIRKVTETAITQAKSIGL